MSVEWNKPSITGRDDYYYTLEYTGGESVKLINQSQVVSHLITGLKPFTSYTISVTVANGVSDQDKQNESERKCTLIATTAEEGLNNHI